MQIWRGQYSRTVVMSAALAAFAVCCVLPVAWLLTTTLGASSGAFGALALDSRQRGLLSNTIVLGAGTAALATAIGAPAGFVLARVPIRRKALMRLLAGVPVLLPPYVAGLAWISIGGGRSEWTYSLPAAILVQSLVLYPRSMRATEVGLRRIDGRMEEAALVVAPPGRVLWRITLPLVRPGVVAAAMIIFVLAVSEFGVPGLLRVRVYTTEVFTAFAALYDFSRAIVLAVPLLMLCVVVAAVAAVMLGDRLATARRSVGVSPVMFGSWRRPATAAVFIVIASAVVVPLLALVRQATDARSFATAMSGSVEATVKSLLLAATGATFVVVVAVWLGYLQARANRRVRLAAQTVLVALFAIPSTVIGVALIGLWNRPGPFGALYGTDAMFMFAYLARFVPVAALILASTTETVSASQEEAAAVSGVGWFRTIRGIVLPQLRVGIAAVWVVVFVLCFGELGATILVAPPGEATLPIRVYTLIANAPPSDVALLALLQTLVIFLPVATFGAYSSLREAR